VRAGCLVDDGSKERALERTLDGLDDRGRSQVWVRDGAKVHVWSEREGLREGELGDVAEDEPDVFAGHWWTVA
jgi:hypothetical protein